MAMVGHKTEAIYRRYAIVDEGALREAATLLDADAVTRVELGQKTDTIDLGVVSFAEKPVMREGGLEPPRLAAPDPKSGASAIPPLSPWPRNCASYDRKNGRRSKRAALHEPAPAGPRRRRTARILKIIFLR